MKIVKSHIINAKLKFRLVSSVNFNSKIKKFIQTNEKSIFVITEYSELFGLYSEINLELLDQSNNFPFINGILYLFF